MSKEIAQENNDIIELHTLIANSIKSLVKKFELNCIGLVFPNQGPVGVVQLRSILAERLFIPTVIIRVNEKLLRNQVWFERSESSRLPVGPSSKILLLCDAATSGASIYRASIIVKKFGADCSNALVLYDRMQGACERLQLKGINLYSLINRAFFEHYGELQKEDTEQDEKASRLEFESISLSV